MSRSTAIALLGATGCHVLFPLQEPGDALVEPPRVEMSVAAPVLAVTMQPVDLSFAGDPARTVFYRATASAGSLDVIDGSVALPDSGLAMQKLIWTTPDDYVRTTLAIECSYDETLETVTTDSIDVAVLEQLGHLDLASATPVDPDELIASPILVAPRDAEVVRLGIRVGITNATRGLLGLYSDAASSGPGTLITATTPFDIPGGAILNTIEVPISEVVVPGKYWVAFVAETQVLIDSDTAEATGLSAPSGGFVLPATFPKSSATNGRWGISATIGPVP